MEACETSIGEINTPNEGKGGRRKEKGERRKGLASEVGAPTDHKG